MLDKNYMQDVTKAQLTIGLLAYFATIWVLVLIQDYSDLLIATGTILLQFILILVLSYVIIAILEWIKIFDLKINAIITLIILVTIGIMIVLNQIIQTIESVTII